jgi:hypothetical protein
MARPASPSGNTCLTATVIMAMDGCLLSVCEHQTSIHRGQERRARRGRAGLGVPGGPEPTGGTTRVSGGTRVAAGARNGASGGVRGAGRAAARRERYFRSAGARAAVARGDGASGGRGRGRRRAGGRLVSGGVGGGGAGDEAGAVYDHSLEGARADHDALAGVRNPGDEPEEQVREAPAKRQGGLRGASLRLAATASRRWSPRPASTPGA